LRTCMDRAKREPLTDGLDMHAMPTVILSLALYVLSLRSRRAHR